MHDRTTTLLWRRWRAALALFLLAAATGAYLRFGFLAGMGGLSYPNVRHAHSHLMFFGWVTPALMALIGARLPAWTGRPPGRGLVWSISLALAAGLLAYFPFLFFGYGLAPVAGRRLPLSVMAAGLNVLVWYGFAAATWRETRGAPRTTPLRLWDVALGFLVGSTVGTIGLPIMTALGAEDAFWSTALTHIFLDLFTEGWFVLGVLGLAYAEWPAAAASPWSRRGTDLMIMGLPVIWLIYLPVAQVPPIARLVGAIGGLLATAGLAAHLAALWPVARTWRLPLFFLGLKAGSQLLLLPAGWAQWAEAMRLRIPYLHWLLLGFATLGLLAAAEARWGARRAPGRRWLAAAVIAISLSLVPLTGLWPGAWGGRWPYDLAAWVALGPALVAGGMLLWPLWERRSAPAPLAAGRGRG